MCSPCQPADIGPTAVACPYILFCSVFNSEMNDIFFIFMININFTVLQIYIFLHALPHWNFNRRWKTDENPNLLFKNSSIDFLHHALTNHFTSGVTLKIITTIHIFYKHNVYKHEAQIQGKVKAYIKHNDQPEFSTKNSKNTNCSFAPNKTVVEF